MFNTKYLQVREQTLTHSEKQSRLVTFHDLIPYSAHLYRSYWDFISWHKIIYIIILKQLDKCTTICCFTTYFWTALPSWEKKIKNIKGFVVNYQSQITEKSLFLEWW